MGIATGFLIHTHPSQQTHPAVAFGSGGQFLVVWEDDRSGHSDIWGARATPPTVHDLAGIQVSNAPNAQTLPAVATIGSTYFVVWSDLRNLIDKDVRGARVDSAGAVLDPVGTGLHVAVRPKDQADPAATSGGGLFFVPYTEEAP